MLYSKHFECKPKILTDKSTFSCRICSHRGCATRQLGTRKFHPSLYHQRDQVMTIKSWAFKQDYWHYFSLEMYVCIKFQSSSLLLTINRIPDLNVMDPKSVLDFNELSIDGLSWALAIRASLNHMHGLIGESCHFDILECRGTRLVIRTHTDDQTKFISSLSAHQFNLKDLMGSSIISVDLNCRISISNNSPFLGLVAC